MRAGALIVVTSLAFAAPPALAAPSDPDPSYGQGGLSLVDAFVAVRDAASTPDAGIVVAGDQFRVVKLTRSGALDRSFGVNGIAMASVPAPQALFDSWALMVQDDGRIVVGGMDHPVWDGDPGAHFALARFLADGTPDPSFGSDGMVVLTIAPGERDSEVRAVIPAPGGGVIACGSVDGLQGPGTLVLARFDASGRLDPGFGSGGVVRGAAGLCDGMARGPGATVVVGGSLEYAAQNPTFLAARYLADGSPDRSFGSGGFVTTAVPLESACNHIHVLPQPDGKVVLTGERDAEFELLRLDASGQPDPTFGTDGVVTTRTSQSLFCGPAALQANGKIILGGTELVPPSNRRFAAARYLPDGSLDPSFGGGVVFSSFGASRYADVGALVLQPDGRIVAIGGVGGEDNNLYLGALRLLGDGPGGAAADPDSLGWSPPPPPPAVGDSRAAPTDAGSALASAPSARTKRSRHAPSSTSPPDAPDAASLQARRATLRVVLASLRRTLATRKARRLLARGGLTIEVVLPSGSRLALALPGLGASHATVARGSARARRGATRLRLRTTRTGMHLLQASGRLHLGARARLLTSSGRDIVASTKVTLPAAAR